MNAPLSTAGLVVIELDVEHIDLDTFYGKFRAVRAATDNLNARCTAHAATVAALLAESRALRGQASN